MKVISLKKDSFNKGGAVITLLPEDKEDLFTVYQIVDKDDELIFKKKFTSKLDEAGKKKSTDLVKLKIKVISEDFDMKDEYLKYKGVTVTDESGASNVDIPVGKYLSFTLDYVYPFTIIKQNFNKFMQKLLNEACNIEYKSDTAAVVLQEGIAHVCLVTSSSTILKQKIEYSMPKKKRTTDVLKFDEKTEKFYKAIYSAMKKDLNFDKLKTIILCSPGFYAKILMDKIFQYAEEEHNKKILDNKGMFFIAHCSTGYLQGINEVLKNPLYASKLQDTKYSKEIMVMDEFLLHLNKDDDKAWYGEKEVVKAAEYGAISYLLLTDKILHSDNIAQREEYLKLMDSVESNGGKALVLSTLHSLGEELDQLTGIACILKYPLPDLDEDDGEE
ncbi:ALS_1a_G0047800.mRNA.1.CDS.1 [Saccharomyces cerevisiae]|nr:Dom34p [Saccharomyces cerevisiae YJM681]CAI4752505.1 ALS_1a_G0047800.mRNA.1.CDS.1 [Saccharomyces cerevisiae]CAI6873280.1 ALS_1a_G0047800.mRNA.1.CDS.1 [Saccharomyces cerevisiae]